MTKKVKNNKNRLILCVGFVILVFSSFLISSQGVNGETVTLRGNSAVIQIDKFELSESEIEYYIIVHDETDESFEEIYGLNLAQGQEIATSGLDIEVTGVIGNTANGGQIIEVESIEILGSVADSDDADHTLGEQRILVLLMDNNNNHVNDDGDVVSVTDVRNLFFNENYDENGDGLSDSVAAWVRKVSYGKAWVSGEVHGYYVSDDVCNFYYNSDLYELADEDVNFLDFDRIVVFLPSYICEDDAPGRGSIGKNTRNTPDGRHSYSSTLINGMSEFSFAIANHELGHNLGLYHAATNKGGSYRQYGDHWDVMGGEDGNINLFLQHSHHFSAINKEKIKWIDSNNIKETLSGTYTIKAMEITGSGLKTIKIPVGGLNYYIEYRRSLDYDVLSDNEAEDTYDGVFVRTDEPYYNDEGYKTSGTMLLDMTPNNPTIDSILEVGDDFYDPQTELRIEVLSINSNSAKVTVSVNCEGFCAGITEPTGIPPAIIAASGANACMGIRLACDKVQSNCVNIGLEDEWIDTSESCVRFFSNNNRPTSSCLYRAICNSNLHDSDNTRLPISPDNPSFLTKGILQFGKTEDRWFTPDQCISNIDAGDFYINGGKYFSAHTICPSEKICTNGKCENAPSNCEDECDNDHGGLRNDGCMGNFYRWSCGEANDGDLCLDKIYDECDEGKVCRSVGTKNICVGATWRNLNTATADVELEVECEDCTGNVLYEIFDMYGGEVDDSPLSAVFEDGVAKAIWNTNEEEGNSFNFIADTNGMTVSSNSLLLPATCGNNILEEGEYCDDGNDITDGCMYGQTSCHVCNNVCNVINGQASYCGDNILNGNEQCDDGNVASGDGCNQLCNIEPYYKVFVTSQTWQGNLGSLEAADNRCQNAAISAGLSGLWKAWISNSTVSASSRLNHATKAYRTLDGKIIANNWDDLTDGTLDNVFNINENGVILSAGERVWTGTNVNGNGISTFASCMNWNSNIAGASAYYGNPGMINYFWTANNDANKRCNEMLHLYCIQQPGGGGGGSGLGSKGPMHLSADIDNLEDHTA